MTPEIEKESAQPSTEPNVDPVVAMTADVQVEEAEAPVVPVDPFKDIDDNDMEALLAANLKGLCMKPGSLITGVVSKVDDEMVSVYVGLKSEGLIPKAEFVDQDGNFEIKESDEVEVALELVEDGNGSTILSRERALRLSAWAKMRAAHESGEAVTGYLRGRVKGGFSVEIGNVRAFLPGSLMDVQPVYDATHLENEPLQLRIIKFDQERNNVVVSRRAVLLDALYKDKDGLIARMEVGQVHEGLVKNLTSYGAFVDLGGVDGLLHNTDIAWQRVNHPSEVIKAGDKINVKVLDFNRESLRISLGLKQLDGEDPWQSVGEKYPIGSKHEGKVTGVRDYGCFVDLGKGIEGLVHASEMDWRNRRIVPSELTSVGAAVQVMVLEIDNERRRISLGMKQCRDSPWEEFRNSNPPGSKIAGVIQDTTEFGIFVHLKEDIEGLVHLSEISWTQDGAEAIKEFHKGDKIDVVVLSVDIDRQRISLGIKQLDDNPLEGFTKTHSKGDRIKVAVTAVQADRVMVAVTDKIESVMRTRDITLESGIDDLRELVKEGQQLEVRIKAIDFSRGQVQVSMTEAEREDQREAMKEHKKQVEKEKEVKLGDILDSLDSSDPQQDSPQE